MSCYLNISNETKIDYVLMTNIGLFIVTKIYCAIKTNICYIESKAYLIKKNANLYKINLRQLHFIQFQIYTSICIYVCVCVYSNIFILNPVIGVCDANSIANSKVRWHDIGVLPNSCI